MTKKRKAATRKPARSKTGNTLTVAEARRRLDQTKRILAAPSPEVAPPEFRDFDDLLAKLQRVEAAACRALDVLPAWCEFLTATLDSHAPSKPTRQALERLTREARLPDVREPIRDLRAAAVEVPAVPHSWEPWLASTPDPARFAYESSIAAVAIVRADEGLGALAGAALFALDGKDERGNDLPDDDVRFVVLWGRLGGLCHDLREELPRLARALASLTDAVEAARAGGINLDAALYPDLPRERWWQGPAPRTPIASEGDLDTNLRWIEDEATHLTAGGDRLRMLCDALANALEWCRRNVKGARPEHPGAIASEVDARAAVYNLRGWLQARAGAPDNREANAVRLDECMYQVGNGAPFTVTSREDTVLVALIELRAATLDQLKDRSGYDYPEKVLRQIQESYPQLAPHVVFPGRKARGGYRTFRLACAQHAPTT